MSKLTAPLLSFGARGQIGKTLVVGSWKGQSYARSYVIPANPQTTGQQTTRNAFSFLQSVYKVAPTEITAAWELYAKGKILTARNAFTKFNLPDIRDQSDLDIFTMSPGALGGLPPASITVTGGTNQITVACTAPATLPTGWTIDSAILAILKDQDPQTGTDYVITAVEDASDPYSNAFTGLTPTDVYQGFAFLKWTRADGFTAYSPSLQDKATVTA